VLINAHEGEGLVDIERLERGQLLHVQRWTLAPGVSEGRHTHGHDTVGDEAYYVLSGVVTVTRGENEFALAPGQSILLRPDETRAIRNDGDQDATILVIFTSSKG
jgi:quercetin dioxygenase-like cupin family protein